MNGLYRTVKYCATIPMLIGVSIFVLWLVTRIDELMLLGAFALYIGLGFLAVGLLALAGYYWTGSRRPDIPRQQLRMSTLKGAGLLFSNFLVAGGIIVAVLAIACRYTVEVHNATPLPLDEVRIHGAGVEDTFGPIPPGATVERTFCIEHDGSLTLVAASGAWVYTQNISGYVTTLIGERQRRVRVDPDGSVTVLPDPRRSGL